MLKLAEAGRYNHLDDEEYLKKIFYARMGYPLDLEHPRTFNEKLQWLKLNKRLPVQTVMVDKLRAKEYVAEKIGEQYIIPTLKVWNNAEEINFDELPDQFVLKVTHDSGGLVICRDKNSLNRKKTRRFFNRRLKRDYYLVNREWPYKDVPRKIIAEQYMEDSGSRELTDYKFYCFNGKVQFPYVSHGLENHKTARRSFLNRDWTFADFGRSDAAPFERLPAKPVNFEKMIDLAEKLSMGFDFLRVDFYEINGRIYFSELTFTPCAGFMPFNPARYDLILGNMIKPD